MGQESFVHFFIEVLVVVSYRAIVFWKRKYKIELHKGSKKVANVSTAYSKHSFNMLSLVAPISYAQRQPAFPLSSGKETASERGHVLLTNCRFEQKRRLQTLYK